MSEKKKLFLLDAYAIIFRAHFAFSKTPRITSTGINSSAVFGFLNSMMEVINKEKPTHIGVAFDLPGSTVRTEEYAEYKAHREETPEDILVATPYIRRILDAWGIPILQAEGYEADDVVGTLAKKAQADGFEVYMMTLDKDYAQLVDENIFLYKLSTFGRGTEVYDVAKVKEKWGVERVDQVADILGLWGDAVDNIPGIPGIGEKTAKKLIETYGSVENLVANAEDLKGKQKENVINFGEQGILSKKLATIILDVPVEWDAEKLIYVKPDKEKLEPIFDELEFKTFKKRLFGEEEVTAPKATAKAAAPSNQMDLFSAPAVTPEKKSEILPSDDGEGVILIPKETIDSTLHDYYLVDKKEDRVRLIEFLSKQKEFCFDTETTSLNAVEAKLVGMSFCYRKGEAYYVPVPQDEKEAQTLVEEFKPVFEHAGIGKVGQNLKYDIMVLKNYAIEVKGPLFDTMIAHYLLQPDLRHNMDFLASTYLNYEPVSITELIGKKGINQGNMADLQPAEISDYAAEDADITWQLKEVFTPEIDTINKKLFNEVEIPLINVLADIERNGVKLDVVVLEQMSEELEKDSVALEQKIYEQAGAQFNIASPKQLGEILFDKLQLDPKAKKTKTGQYKTDESVLSRLAEEHKIIDDILSFREYRKLKSTYVDALPKMVMPSTGRIHTSYRQAVAATGRLSSDNPNLQNIPIRTEKGRAIRKAFVPTDENHILVSADYSQIELRIMAAFAKDENMIAAFKEGRDIHATTAAKVFKTPLEDVTREQRGQAKAVNFGIIYGISAFGLSQNLNISRTEAAEIIESYFTEFSAVKTFMDATINNAREHEYVETILGRRRYLRDINSRNQTTRGYAERNAINAPIQGSAADMIKVAMINIHQWMKNEKLKSKMILQVHDELVFDTHLSELELIKTKVPEFMKTAIPLDVPMEIGLGEGVNWLEAH